MKCLVEIAPNVGRWSSGILALELWDNIFTQSKSDVWGKKNVFAFPYWILSSLISGNPRPLMIEEIIL